MRLRTCCSVVRLAGRAASLGPARVGAVVVWPATTVRAVRGRARRGTRPHTRLLFRTAQSHRSVVAGVSAGDRLRWSEHGGGEPKGKPNRTADPESSAGSGAQNAGRASEPQRDRRARGAAVPPASRASHVSGPTDTCVATGGRPASPARDRLHLASCSPRPRPTRSCYCCRARP